jgi:hypothetical protein
MTSRAAVVWVLQIADGAAVAEAEGCGLVVVNIN